MKAKEIINKITAFIKGVPEGRRKNIEAGFWTCAIVSLFFGYIFGFISAVCIGAWLEGYYYFTHKGKPEFKDFLCMTGGAFAFIVVSMLVSLLVCLIGQAFN